MERELTDEQVVEVRVCLTVMREIHALVGERIAHSDQLSDDDPETYAYLVATRGMQNVETKLVNELAEKLGVNLDDLDESERLAEVINILDGKRRRARL